MTGRAAGFCAGYDEAGWVSAPGVGGRGRRSGRGFGPGFGRGRGFGRGYAYGPPLGGGYGRGVGPGWFDAPAAPENRKAILQSEVEELESRLEYLKREIDAADRETGNEQA